MDAGVQTDGKAAEIPDTETNSNLMTIGAFQICWHDRHFTQLESGFIALDWRHNPQPHLREFAVFRQLGSDQVTGRFDLVGALSPKFAAKTGVTGRDFTRWIENTPGYDFYFINPRPQHPAFFFNAWHQSTLQFGDRFVSAAKEIIELAGYDFDTWSGQRANFDTFFCMNYWIAGRDIWDKFLRVVDDILAVDPLKLNENTRSYLFEPRHWRAANQLPFPLITIVLERVITSLVIADSSFRSIGYPITSERIRTGCRHPAEWELYRTFAPIASDLDRNDVAASRDGRMHFDRTGRVQIALVNLLDRQFGHPHGDIDAQQPPAFPQTE